jgi:hypothetical protein
MGSQVIEKTATTSADADIVYALLRDGGTWPEWSPIDSFELERADGARRSRDDSRSWPRIRHA